MVDNIMVDYKNVRLTISVDLFISNSKGPSMYTLSMYISVFINIFSIYYSSINQLGQINCECNLDFVYFEYIHAYITNT